MTNQELGEFIASKEFEKSSAELVKNTEEIIGSGFDLATTVFLGIPAYSLLKPFIEDLRNWKSRVELKQIAYFFKYFETLSQNERSEFSYLIQNAEEDFTEKMFYYISQLNDKRKAQICGKLGVAMARKKLSPSKFLSLIQKVQNVYFDDLMLLKDFVDLHKMNQGKEYSIEIEKLIFTSTFNNRFEILNIQDRSTLISHGFLVEKNLWNNLRGDLKEMRVVINAFKDAISNIALTDISFYLYNYGLRED